MKKLISVTLLLLLSVTALFAADQGRKILDKASDRISVSKGFTASFTISSSKFTNAGTISVKGNKFCART